MVGTSIFLANDGVDRYVLNRKGDCEITCKADYFRLVDTTRLHIRPYFYDVSVNADTYKLQDTRICIWE